MSLASVAEPQWEADSASYDGGKWTYQRQWQVKVTDRYDGPDTVSTAQNLPAYGELYPWPVGNNAYCTKISYSRKAPLAWLVDATYETIQGAIEENPLNDNPVIKWGSEIYQDVVVQDQDGYGVLNSAGDFFDPPPTRDACNLIANISSNVASVPVWALNYQNAVNDSEIVVGGLSVAQRLARVSKFAISEAKKRGIYDYYVFSYDIHMKIDGWRLSVLDAGFRELNVAGDGLKKIRNSDDSADVTQPALLDGSGRAISNPEPSDAQFREFTIYPELDLSVLPGISAAA